jgi:uncharacterized membrane protein YeaQ/YmgE (transglycosylase-associated protein family)
MSLVIFVMWVVVGLVAGWLAGFVVKRGGYGLRADIILGLVGGIVGTWIWWALRVTAEAGIAALTIVAIVGAFSLIVVQRQIWPTVA